MYIVYKRTRIFIYSKQSELGGGKESSRRKFQGKFINLANKIVNLAQKKKKIFSPIKKNHSEMVVSVCLVWRRKRAVTMFYFILLFSAGDVDQSGIA